MEGGSRSSVLGFRRWPRPETATAQTAQLRGSLSCSQARREREHTVCFLRGGSPRSPPTLRAANASPRNPGERGGRRRYRSACDSSRRAAQRKSPYHGGRCSARGQTPWHTSPPPCARKTRRIAERLRHLVAVGPIVGQPPRRKKEGGKVRKRSRRRKQSRVVRSSHCCFGFQPPVAALEGPVTPPATAP